MVWYKATKGQLPEALGLRYTALLCSFVYTRLLLYLYTPLLSYYIVHNAPMYALCMRGSTLEVLLHKFTLLYLSHVYHLHIVCQKWEWGQKKGELLLFSLYFLYPLLCLVQKTFTPTTCAIQALLYVHTGGHVVKKFRPHLPCGHRTVEPGYSIELHFLPWIYGGDFNGPNPCHGCHISFWHGNHGLLLETAAYEKILWGQNWATEFPFHRRLKTAIIGGELNAVMTRNPRPFRAKIPSCAHTVRMYWHVAVVLWLHVNTVLV